MQYINKYTTLGMLSNLSVINTRTKSYQVIGYKGYNQLFTVLISEKK